MKLYIILSYAQITHVGWTVFILYAQPENRHLRKSKADTIFILFINKSHEKQLYKGCLRRWSPHRVPSCWKQEKTYRNRSPPVSSRENSWEQVGGKSSHIWGFYSNEAIGPAQVFRYCDMQNMFVHLYIIYTHIKKHKPRVHPRTDIALKDARGHCLIHARKFFQGHVNIPDALGYKQACRIGERKFDLNPAIQGCLSLPTYLCTRMAEWPLCVYLW